MNDTSVSWSQASEEAIADFVPQMERAFGSSWLSKVWFPDGTEGTMPSADFVFPKTEPIVVIEHKIEMSQHLYARGRRQLDSYVTNAHWSGKLKGRVLGIVSDGTLWYVREYRNGAAASGWAERTYAELSSLVVNKSVPLTEEDRYHLVPSRENRNRQLRERYQEDPEWREAQKEKARNRYHERYRDDPEFRERKKAEYHERRKADPEWRAAEQDRKRVAYRERYQNDPEWREAEKARSRAYRKRVREQVGC